MTQTSYFIGFLIFVATIMTNQALAADALTPVHEYGMVILVRVCIILASAFILPLLYGMIRITLDRDQPEDKAAYFVNMLTYSVLSTMWVLFGLIVLAFVKVMMNMTWLSIFCDWLGTKDKKDTLTFIGFGMGGALASINGIALHIRAREQGRNNQLIEKGHFENRFKFASETLKSENSVMLVSAFYQFYYLAKCHNVGDFRKNIFDVLCFYLRRRLKEKSITEECQKLLDILFKSEYRAMFRKFYADLQSVNFSHANLSNADLSNADLSNANLQKAQLKGANLRDVYSIEKADFRGAKIGDKDITKTDIPNNKGNYYADWTDSPPPKPDTPPKKLRITPAKSGENEV